MSYDVTVVDDLGQRLCTLHNFEVARHQLSPRRTISSPLHIMWQPVFQGTTESESLICGDEPASTDQVSGERDVIEPHP
jgi:hypothetical protein